MRTNFCHTFVAFILKFLNLLLTFIGISIIVYSGYMLNQWNKHPFNPPPVAPSPGQSMNLPSGIVSGLDEQIKLHAPVPWFIYAFMALGIVLCSITCIGHIAAEAINGCCLCCYTFLTTVLVLFEVALVAFIAIDRHWERDLPYDPTGELNALRSFVESNLDLCKWVGVVVIIIQGLSLLFAIILKSMISTQRREEENDIEGECEPLITPQTGQTSASPGTHSDIWSLRMRQKYGLSSVGNASYTSLNQNAQVDKKT